MLQRWHATGCRGWLDLSLTKSFTKQLPGQRYQGILNGYDMICPASFLIKACWGNVSATARRLAGRSSVNADHCLSPSFLQRSKFHCDYTKGSGHWPGLLDMLWWGDREANQSSSNQPSSGCDKNWFLPCSSVEICFFLVVCFFSCCRKMQLWHVDTRCKHMVIKKIIIFTCVGGSDGFNQSSG